MKHKQTNEMVVKIFMVRVEIKGMIGDFMVSASDAEDARKRVMEMMPSGVILFVSEKKGD